MSIWPSFRFAIGRPQRFDYTMFALIVLNCVGMTLEHPYIRAGSPLDKALYWSNVGFTILFTIEAVVKMFAYTFIAYIKRITNQVGARFFRNALQGERG